MLSVFNIHIRSRLLHISNISVYIKFNNKTFFVHKLSLRLLASFNTRSAISQLAIGQNLIFCSPNFMTKVEQLTSKMYVS